MIIPYPRKVSLGKIQRYRLRFIFPTKRCFLIEMRSMPACKPSLIIVIDEGYAIGWRACSWSGCWRNEQGKWVTVEWLIGPNYAPMNWASSSSSNASACLIPVPGAGFWDMAWSPTRWNRSLCHLSYILRGFII